MSEPLHQDWNSTQVPQRLHGGSDTSKCGTDTKSVLVLHCLGVSVPLPHCMWVPVLVNVVPVPLPL